jgi:hypothetical protein
MREILRRMSGTQQRWAILLASGASLLVMLALVGGARIRAQDDVSDEDESKIRTGFAIAPVELNLKGKNPALVGLGSYIVNAQSSCSECHTWPNFASGGNPYLGEPEQINTAGYLAGGRVFPNGTVSRNLTPDPDTGRPADLTFEEFVVVIRTGIDLDGDLPHIPSADLDLLQTMPWPVFRKMSDRELRAIYEYLSAIPSVP